MTKSINKADFVELLANEIGLSKAQTAKVIDSFFAVLMKQLSSKAKIVLTGLISFSIINKKAREGRNPKTGAKMKIPAKDAVKVKIGKKFSEGVFAVKKKK